MTDYEKITTDTVGRAHVLFDGVPGTRAPSTRVRSKCSDMYRLRYLTILIILVIFQHTIGPSLPYIINTFFASAHGGGDCVVNPKSKACRMGAADHALYKAYSHVPSNAVAVLSALGNGSCSDAVGRLPLLRLAALLQLLPPIALGMHLLAGCTLWVYLGLLPIVMMFDLNGVHMALMSDLVPQPEERAAAFGFFMAVLLTVCAFVMPIAFLIPQKIALMVSIIAASARVLYLFTLFPETSPKAASEADRAGIVATYRFAFRVLTRHSFILRATCTFILFGLGASGFAIVFPPFMTGYLGFERVHMLMLFLAAGGSMLFTFMFILSPLIRCFGEIWQLILLVGIFAGPLITSCPVVMAIKSNLVKQDEQGLIQGALASIAKGVAIIGFIFFSLLFKFSTKGGEIKSQRTLYAPCFTIAFILSLGCMVACTLPLTPPPPPPPKELDM